MKLVFYSGGQSRKNRVLHQALADLVNRKARKSLTYIPFCADGAECYYRRAMRRYAAYGFSRFQMLTVDERLDAVTVKRAFESDVIYLAGGNTFYFLLHLRKSGLLSKLKKFAKDGGVVAGLSAGALIMTPSIGLAGYPTWEADENDVGLRDLHALGLVGFEFFPHFERTPRLIRALARYSRTHSNSIFTAEDGGGIVVNGKQTTLLGRVSLVTGGEYHEIR